MRRTSYTTCPVCGKRAYRTEHDAGKALGQCQHQLRQLRRKRVSPILRAERRIYECEWTGLWHLTSQRSFDK